MTDFLRASWDEIRCTVETLPGVSLRDDGEGRYGYLLGRNGWAFDGPHREPAVVSFDGDTRIVSRMSAGRPTGPSALVRPNGTIIVSFYGPSGHVTQWPDGTPGILHIESSGVVTRAHMISGSSKRDHIKDSWDARSGWEKTRCRPAPTSRCLDRAWCSTGGVSV